MLKYVAVLVAAVFAFGSVERDCPGEREKSRRPKSARRIPKMAGCEEEGKKEEKK